MRDTEINWPRLIPLLRGMLNEDFQGNREALVGFLEMLVGRIENELPLPSSNDDTNAAIDLLPT